MKRKILRNGLVYVLALFAVSVFIYGCSDDGTEENRTGLELSEPEIQVLVQGGSYTINYTLENPIKGVLVEARCADESDNEWIHSFDFFLPDAIRFKVEPNPEAKERDAEIIVTYNEGKIEKTFTVRQDGISAAFEISFREIDETRILV